MRINSKTFRQWLLTNFTRQELKEIATHGADTGWNGLCYYSETTKLFECFKYELPEMTVLDSLKEGILPMMFDQDGGLPVYQVAMEIDGNGTIRRNEKH